MKAFFIKVDGALYPDGEIGANLLKKFPTGEAVSVEIKRARNYAFHKKWFALMNFAFDYWEPGNIAVKPRVMADCVVNGMAPTKNFDRFRKDVTILAGFYEQTIRLNGEVRTEAKSISFGSMSEDEFEELYSKTIDVLVKYVLHQYTGRELRSILDTIEGFE